MDEKNWLKSEKGGPIWILPRDKDGASEKTCGGGKSAHEEGVNSGSNPTGGV